MSDEPTPNVPLVAPLIAPDAVVDPMDRRDFLRVAGVGAGAMLVTGCATGSGGPALVPARGISPARATRGSGHIVVVGGGAWGGWTSLYLRRRGARVTMIDAYGPGNSRASSGDETRGIRSSYGDRATAGELWTSWARTAIGRWKAFDDEYAKEFKTKFFHQTGDVICRAQDEPFVKRTRELWTAQGVAHEVIDGAEVMKRWPVINARDITIAITEPDAGVARARAATQAVAAIAQREGVQLIISRARPGAIVSGKMDGVVLEDGTVVRGDQYVFCCGPWLRKVFPQHLDNRMRVPMGYVCYFSVPEGDRRFTFPNLPSYNFPGVTGWPALPVDLRGFRVRGAIAPPNAAPPTEAERKAAQERAAAQAALDLSQNDPDISNRWMNQDRIDGSRRFVQARFPLLADMPLNETRACHYESSINRDFIIDHLPDASNAWVAGVGQAEGFKFGPVVGEYVAQRVLGFAGDPALVEAFKFPTKEYEKPTDPWNDEE
ncbi:MAG: FAD-dependent oxidoreductase [Gemmatimonadetes bacterium]|nr:FAD-dependent oxidoreductase [Gemmatimonadota bacterium]MBK9408052.1 FAD-dependent oxidoreductase [Gemmatimonadota bacterium]